MLRYLTLHELVAVAEKITNPNYDVKLDWLHRIKISKKYHATVLGFLDDCKFEHIFSHVHNRFVKVEIIAFTNDCLGLLYRATVKRNLLICEGWLDNFKEIIKGMNLQDARFQSCEISII